MGFSKVQNCCLHLSEGLSDKQTVSLAEEAAHLADNIYVSGMDLGKGDCQLVTDAQLSLKSPILNLYFSRIFEVSGLLSN